MSEEVYILTEIEWLYNDETYSTSEQESGQPIAVYKHRENAEIALVDANAEIAQKRFGKHYGGVGSFGWEIDEITNLSTEELRKGLADIELVWDGEDLYALPSPDENADVDTWKKYISLFNINFVKIQVTKLEDM